MSLNDLESICKEKFNDLVIVNEIKKDYLVLELLNSTTKNQFLENILKENIDIEKFAVYEPDLTDIFVKKVGKE
ncbi:hypothetical protein H477_1733 [[Clostridium] sordellii ATCC 9714]|nr:hypothetical protein H477_1733 [[Clostridium] sordellii ATCC 9714] [Paeniclostridium sordellii ATCC 9714]